MQRGHRSRLNPAAEAVAHHQVVTFAQLRDERGNVREVVTLIGVAHDHEFTARSGEAAEQRAAVPFSFDRDNARAQAACNLDGAIRASIIGDHHFAAQSRALECGESLGDTDADGFFLVEARHHHRDFDVGDWRISFNFGR